jgi:hypothetical protein
MRLRVERFGTSLGRRPFLAELSNTITLDCDRGVEGSGPFLRV